MAAYFGAGTAHFTPAWIIPPPPMMAPGMVNYGQQFGGMAGGGCGYVEMMYPAMGGYQLAGHGGFPYYTPVPQLPQQQFPQQQLPQQQLPQQQFPQQQFPAQQQWVRTRTDSEEDHPKDRPKSMCEISRPDYKIQGRYKVISKLGQGSFGTVLKVVDSITFRVVAIKVSNNDRAGMVLSDEIRMLLKLNRVDDVNKQRIVQLVDSFGYEGRRMMICEFVDLSLREFLKQHGESLRFSTKRGLTLHQTKYFAFQIMEGVHFMRQNGVMHLDLKPSNIMVKGTGTDPQELQLKIIDFGSARFIGQRYTSKPAQTRYYRSIEVVLGHRPTEACDIWSVGCVIAEMHIGRPLFPAKVRGDMLHHIVLMLGEPPQKLFRPNRPPPIMPEPRFLYHPTSNTFCGPPVAATPQLITALRKEFIKFDDLPHHFEILAEERRLMELVAKMLDYDYKHRITTKEILMDPFFQA